MATTIYTPQNPSPRNEVRDMSLNQDFTVTVDGVKYTDYQIRIYRVSDNVLVHDSTKINLGTPLSNGQTLTHVIVGGTISNTGNDSYKWTIQVWNGSETKTTREFQFFAKTTPVLTFTVPSIIGEQSYEFTATLTQAQGDIVNNYTFELYDQVGDTLLESSGNITNFNVFYRFEGFISGDLLSVRVFGETTGGQLFDSGKISFEVQYPESDIDIIPEVTVNQDTSVVKIERGNVVQIIGNETGTMAFSPFFDSDMQYLELQDSANQVSWDVDVPLDFTISFEWFTDDISFEGKIMELGNGDYEIGYEFRRFYYVINGVKIHLNPLELKLNRIFYIFVLPTKVVVRHLDVVI